MLAKALQRKQSMASSPSNRAFTQVQIDNEEEDEEDYLTRDAIFALKFVGK